MLALAAASFAGPVVAATPTGDVPSATDLRAGEQRAMTLLNEKRAMRGLRALREDPGVSAVARALSQDMIDRGYFDHKDPDGLYARQHLTRARITFERAGEIIAWNHGADLAASADEVVGLWMGSAAHPHEIMADSNYFGAGLASDGDVLKWTVVFITGPDRTKPVARITSATLTDATITVGWSGSDPRLAVHTAGIKSYDLGRRTGGGAWTTIRSHITATVAHVSVDPGQTLEFRVRARDRAGNLGAWSVATLVGVP